jgi:hypothetical protein
MRRPQYGEGFWFAIPLLTSGFGTGLIVRGSRRTKVLFAYFFGPRVDVPPSPEDLIGFEHEDAVLRARTGDSGLYRGEWPIIKNSEPSWSRQRWPMPPVCMHSEFEETAWEITYSDDDPMVPVSQRPISVAECEQLPPDSILGARIIEWRLTELLDPEAFVKIKPFLD